MGAFAAALVCAAPAAASPLELYGSGGRTPALGGAGVATTAGFDSVYTNPAGLGDVTRRRLTLGAMGGHLALSAGGAPVDTEDTGGLLFGGVVPLQLGGAWRDRLVLGVGVHTPRKALARVDVPLPGQPYFALLETRSDIVGVQVALGARLGDRWRVGGGVLALAALRGRIFVDVDGAGEFTSTSEQRLTAQYAPIVGARYGNPGDRWRAGLVVRGPSRSDYEIEVTNDVGDALPLSLPALRLAGAAQYDPAALAGEVAVRVLPPLTVSAHLTAQRWSAYPAPTEAPVMSAPPLDPPEFRDTVTPRLAAELDLDRGLTDVALRAGYAFVMTPAPEARGTQTLLDNHRHVLAAGVGLGWTRSTWPVQLDLWGQLHQLASRTHTKDPERFPDGAPPFDRLETGGRVWVGGVTVGVDL